MKTPRKPGVLTTQKRFRFLVGRWRNDRRLPSTDSGFSPHGLRHSGCTLFFIKEKSAQIERRDG
jgi:hypothetical protein